MAAKNQNQHHEELSSKISDDINCPICLDILVCPRTLVPCGHTFCRSCCFSDSISSKGRKRQTLTFTHCPHCRQEVEETVPARQLESLINTLVTVPNLLFRNEDDKQHFLKRRKIESEKSSTLHTSKRARKRQRHNDCESRHYAAAPNYQVLHQPTNHYPHAHHSVGVAFQPANTYDPMIAPLPPPYDFSTTGPVPVLNFAGSTSPVTVSRSRPPQNAQPAGTSGISANDPICID